MIGNIGMLWFDNDIKQPLENKINRAAKYYEKKYGEEPDFCLVNPEEEIENVYLPFRIGHSDQVLRNHFFLGMELSND